MDQILANLADAVPDTFTDVSGEETELPGEISDVMQVRGQACVIKHMSHQNNLFCKAYTIRILCAFVDINEKICQV